MPAITKAQLLQQIGETHTKKELMALLKHKQEDGNPLLKLKKFVFPDRVFPATINPDPDPDREALPSKSSLQSNIVAPLPVSSLPPHREAPPSKSSSVNWSKVTPAPLDDREALPPNPPLVKRNKVAPAPLDDREAPPSWRNQVVSAFPPENSSPSIVYDRVEVLPENFGKPDPWKLQQQEQERRRLQQQQRGGRPARRIAAVLPRKRSGKATRR
jgi:hypothetical protein